MKGNPRPRYTFLQFCHQYKQGEEKIINEDDHDQKGRSQIFRVPKISSFFTSLNFPDYLLLLPDAEIFEVTDFPRPSNKTSARFFFLLISLAFAKCCLHNSLTLPMNSRNVQTAGNPDFVIKETARITIDEVHRFKHFEKKGRGHF